MKIQRNDPTIDGIVTGDPIVIRSFYEKNFSEIRKYVLARCGNEEDVKDIFQDALIVIYQKSILNLLNINVSLEAYFYGVYRNLWNNRLRKKNKVLYNSFLVERVAEKTFFSNQPNIEKDILKDIFKKCFLKLNDSKKELILLCMEGKSTKEISKITGYTEGYTRKKKSNSKNDLKKMISKDPIYRDLLSA